MTDIELSPIECPKCGQTGEAPIYRSINVSTDPEEKDRLFERQINVYHCENCDDWFQINAPLLYHDMEKKLAVQYYPPEFIEEPDFLEQFTAQGGMDYENLDLPIPDYLRHPHFVFDMEEMIRFITFRERLFYIYSGGNFRV